MSHQYSTERMGFARALAYILSWEIGCLVGLPIIIWRGQFRAVRPMVGYFCAMAIVLGAVSLAYHQDRNGIVAIIYGVVGMLVGLGYIGWANWADAQATSAYHSRRADDIRRRQASQTAKGV